MASWAYKSVAILAKSEAMHMHPGFPPFLGDRYPCGHMRFLRSTKNICVISMSGGLGTNLWAHGLIRAPRLRECLLFFVDQRSLSVIVVSLLDALTFRSLRDTSWKYFTSCCMPARSKWTRSSCSFVWDKSQCHRLPAFQTNLEKTMVPATLFWKKRDSNRNYFWTFAF